MKSKSPPQTKVEESVDERHQASTFSKMSRYPHRGLAEKNKRVQTLNCIEGKFLKQKLDSFSREKLYIDRELRRISLAKESLNESLGRYTVPPKLAKKRLSLPCLIDGNRRDANTRTTSALRRHTMDTVQDLHKVAEGKELLKPLSVAPDPPPTLKDGIPTKSPRGERSALRITSFESQHDDLEIRVTSPVTASLIQSGQIDKSRFNNERPALYSRRTSTAEIPLHLPKLPATPAKRELNPMIPRNVSAGQANPRDGMLATNLKSKFRQIGSVVMAAAILRIASEKKKAAAGNER